MEAITPKLRMLNAYKGIFSDRYPVAPEFCYYYPAKVLGVDMIQFEKEVPLWQALKTTFEKFNTEGWGPAFPDVSYEGIKIKTEKIGQSRYREKIDTVYKKKVFTTVKVYDLNDPSWIEKYPVEKEEDIEIYLQMMMDSHKQIDLTGVNNAYKIVGDAYLLELWTGIPFFDFMAQATGFERMLFFFMNPDNAKFLEYWQKRYIDLQIEFN